MNFNYSPEQADELKLQAGEIVEVIKEVRGRGDDERLWTEVLEGWRCLRCWSACVPREMCEVRVWAMGMVRGAETGK